METYEHSFLQHPIIERNTEMLDQYAKMDGTVTRMDEQYSNNFRREPEHTMRDIEHNRMRQDKMTLTLHTPKK